MCILCGICKIRNKICRWFHFDFLVAILLDHRIHAIYSSIFVSNDSIVLEHTPWSNVCVVRIMCFKCKRWIRNMYPYLNYHPSFLHNCQLILQKWFDANVNDLVYLYLIQWVKQRTRRGRKQCITTYCHGSLSKGTQCNTSNLQYYNDLCCKLGDNCAEHFP